jgi:hypothetical protein
MIIKVYKKWVDWPEGPTRSFKMIGSAFIKLNTQTMAINGIMQRLAFGREEVPTKKENWLVLVTDKDYENCLTGNREQISSFVKDCLVDEGHMNNKWARKKNK